MTIGIIAVTAYAFFLQLSAPDIDAFVMQYALVPQNVNFADWLTLLPFITSMFLHAGWLHILSNMWFLWIFGDNVEAEVGHVRYLLFYLVCGIAAGLVQYFFNSTGTIPTLGASGAVAGVLGAYLMLYPGHKIDTLIPTFGGFMTQAQIPASIMLIYWFVIQLFSGVGTIGMQDVGGVAFWAHVGGFVAGWILVRLLQ